MITFLIPAAGVGRRMRSDCPKQFLPFADTCVLSATVRRLLALPVEKRLVIALPQRTDAKWQHEEFQHQLESHTIILTEGDAERHQSVLAALRAVPDAKEDDPVLVHDAARPVIRDDDILRLVDTLRNQPDGVVLVKPCHNAIKKIANGRVIRSVDRSDMVETLTPQGFSYGLLRRALEQAVSRGYKPADECEAVEYLGRYPLYVYGHADNIKITQPEDLPLAEWLYQRLLNHAENTAG